MSAADISCGDSLDVMLTLGAEPDIASNSTDIVLDLFNPQSANAVATATKAAGVTLYIIGLSGNGGIHETAMRSWKPSSAVLRLR